MESPGRPGSKQYLHDLIRRFCASPPDMDAGNELSDHCIPKIERRIRWAVYGKGFCAPQCGKQEFFEGAEGRAKTAFVRSICTYRFKGLTSWLQSIAETALADEMKKQGGRGKDPKPIRHPKSVEEVLRYRSHASLPQMYHSKYWVDPSALVRDRQIHELVVAALKLHAQGSRRDWMSARAVALFAVEEYPVREIAKEYNRAEGTVYTLLKDDHPKLHKILIEIFGVTSPVREL